VAGAAVQRAQQNRYEPVQFLPQESIPRSARSARRRRSSPSCGDAQAGHGDGTRQQPYRSPQLGAPAQNAPRWRSITQTLSPTIDLSRVEFLEFWVWEDGKRVAKTNQTAILFDFGSVFRTPSRSSPLLHVDGAGDTTYIGVRQAGKGRLDTETRPPHA